MSSTGNVQKTIMTILMWQKSKIIFKIAECCVTFYSEDGHNSNRTAVLWCSMWHRCSWTPTRRVQIHLLWLTVYECLDSISENVPEPNSQNKSFFFYSLFYCTCKFIYFYKLLSFLYDIVKHLEKGVPFKFDHSLQAFLGPAWVLLPKDS